jgi:hypothetical protein
MPEASPQVPGQAKRLLGSLVLTLGAGIMLDSSYQVSGIGVILTGTLLVGWGWTDPWIGLWRAPRQARK